MVKLNKKQLEEKVTFIKNYMNSGNAASVSTYDANANVSSKNISTLDSELNKDINIQVNRSLVQAKIEELFDKETAIEYLRQIEEHEIYVHDESSLKPYTYGASEGIVVYKNGKKILTTFENLYNSYTEIEEFLLDEENNVYVKYPKDLYIEDKNEKVIIKRIIRKDRHRDLVLVKTKNGESLIVTDNHPLITDISDINNTTEAINSFGKYQFKKDTEFVDKNFTIDVEKEFNLENYGSYCISNVNDGKKVEGIKPIIELNDKLGYAIGFFIAEGSYSENFIDITQNDKNVLKKVASYIYETTGISGKIYQDTCPSHNERNIKHKLQYNSIFMRDLLINYFGILPHASRKNLPTNIYETNTNFINGLISGIIDGDGSIGIHNKDKGNHTGNISIRLASRSLISQLSILLRSFGFGISVSYQEQNELAFGSFSSNYPIFGVGFGLTGSLDFNLSFKVNNNRDIITKKTRYKKEISEISEVKIIKNKSYLDNYIYDITTESETFLCNNLIVHNCTSISMYPFLINGLKDLGGESAAPQHLDSFCGSFVNLIFAVSSQFAGAVATVEWLMYFDYFARKDFGDNYLITHTKKIENCLQHCVYAINQPAAARGYQAVFWNISLYDSFYFNSLFGEFVFPDYTTPSWDSVNNLQKFFMKWFNNERSKNVLTFPVITAAMLVDDEKPLDSEFSDFCAEELSEGNSFFIYQSKSADSLSSCCRLRSEVADNTFSYSLGAGGVSTGSINVITINMNRLIQDSRDVVVELNKIYKYQVAYRKLMEDYKNANMMPVYDAGFISLDKQFLTIGINGMVEAAESLGIEASNNDEYKNFITHYLKKIYDSNKLAKSKYGYIFNTEFVPAENLGIKNASWDKKDGYIVERDCYNSYFYAVENDNINIIDKFILHGKELIQYLDGGSALHVNMETYSTKESYNKLIKLSAKCGCNYFCFNVKITICEDCGFINKNTKEHCTKCNSKNVSWATRIIGYLKKIKSFSDKRQVEEAYRIYHKKETV